MQLIIFFSLYLFKKGILKVHQMYTKFSQLHNQIN